MTIYVEIRIQAALDEVWHKTQAPELHEQWDLRFSSITYLPRDDESAPQRFRYSTRLGMGLEVAGWGETVGERLSDGVRTSALRFGSDARGSLIREGSGYWKYTPADDGVVFVTGYDYDVRWGALGRTVDRLIFRPAIGWATAWSFDRLRLWIERGIRPRDSAYRALVHGLATLGVASTWCWQGLVPKLLGPHSDELTMLAQAGVPEAWLATVTQAVGALELAFGLGFPFLARGRAVWWITIALMVAATVGVAVNSPQQITAAFNPVTLNLLLAVLAAIGLMSTTDLPSARRCLRRPAKSPAKP